MHFRSIQSFSETGLCPPVLKKAIFFTQSTNFKVSCKDFTNHGTKNVKNNLTCITLIVNNMCQFDCAKDCPARL